MAGLDKSLPCVFLSCFYFHRELTMDYLTATIGKASSTHSLILPILPIKCIYLASHISLAHTYILRSTYS